ncbi:MAG: hypothetical protein ABIH37_01785 [archaeon]
MKKILVSLGFFILIINLLVIFVYADCAVGPGCPNCLRSDGTYGGCGYCCLPEQSYCYDSDTIYECGEHDGDLCYEWGYINCEVGEVCSDGACIPIPQCNDGIDNDDPEDTLYDYCDGSNPTTCDPGCSSPDDDDETDLPQCSNGEDDDGDTLIDYPDDPGCDDALDNDEFNAPTAQCADDQTILKLFADTNSHAAKYDYSEYYRRLCYDELFGVAYDPGTEDAHGCIGDPSDPTNAVVWLTADFNSHVSAIKDESNGYTIPVCYGELYCTARETNCNPGETLIASLSESGNAPSYYNSHISKGDDLDYNIKLCCISGAIVNDAVWQNMKSDIIGVTAGISADKNDLVKLVVTGEGFEGKTMNFKVYKDIAFWFDAEVVDITTNLGFATWRAGKKSDETFEAGDYYFKVSIEGSEYTSGNLAVADFEDNTPPHVEIINPVMYGIYYLEKSITFLQNTYDEDDEINYVWDLGDGTIKKGDNLYYKNYSFNYVYNIEDQITVKLTGVDSRGLQDKDQVSFLVVKDQVPGDTGAYAFANISEPPFGKVVGRVVDFDADGSFGINVIDDATDTINLCRQIVTCITGDCPQLTETCPACYDTFGYTCPIPVLNAPLEPGDIGYVPPDYSAMTFHWVFDDGTNSDLKLLQKTFASLGSHSAQLTVTYT